MSPPATNQSQKLTLLLPGLTGGGAEKVMVRMADHWASRGNRVTLVTLSSAATDTYELLPSVDRIALDIQADSRGLIVAAKNNYERVLAVRRVVMNSHPDVVISFTEQMNVVALLATFRRRFPVIVSERIDPRHHAVGRLWSSLRRLTYPTSDCVVVQTEELSQYAGRLAGKRRVEVIPNGIDPPAVTLTAMPERRKTIVAAGRLVAQKGFDMLIDAFALLADQHREWSLEIYGTGPAQSQLQKQIESYGLSDRVHLQGWNSELPSVLASSSIFVLSSRYEGFPNALLDAMACGAACVSFACPSGPSEIIRHSIDGLLVEPHDTAALAASLNEVIGNGELRAQLGQHAREVVDRFSYDRFFAHWDRLIASVRTTYSPKRSVNSS